MPVDPRKPAVSQKTRGRHRRGDPKRDDRGQPGRPLDDHAGGDGPRPAYVSGKGKADHVAPDVGWQEAAEERADPIEAQRHEEGHAGGDHGQQRLPAPGRERQARKVDQDGQGGPTERKIRQMF